MSDTDSFIEEVSEEVRRDRLYGYLRRYGWIAVVVILLIVGGTAWNEYRKAQARTQAQALGDRVLAALDNDRDELRAVALAEIGANTPGGAAVVNLLRAAALAGSEQTEQAVQDLNAVATDGALPEIYRQIASFKALLLQAETMPAADRRVQFEALAQPGGALRLLAEEQLALIDLSEGRKDAAVTRLQAILQDAELSADLQQRVSQVIVALGETPQPAQGQTLN